MANVFDQIKDDIYQSISEDRSEFMLFEPWDVEKRPDDFYKKAEEDGVDMLSKELVTVYGIDPHPFQSGPLFDTGRFCLLLAATQIGKTYLNTIDAIIMCTGEIPYSLRIPKGTRTDIRRAVNQLNIRRFGRRDIVTGQIIDFDEYADVDLKSWDCGTVTGAGIYPQEKICRDTSQRIWVGTTKDSKGQQWMPTLRKLIPKRLVDVRRGTQGFSDTHGTTYLANGMQINVKTYEQKFSRFEAKEVWLLILDEEPEDRRILASGSEHAKWLRMSETPYHGMSWTYDDIIKPIVKGTANWKIYHATQYDCPYKLNADITEKKQLLKPHEVGARTYGVHTEQAANSPYWENERDKLRTWIRGHTIDPEYATFVPTEQWENPRELLRISVIKENVSPPADPDEATDEWEVYEPVIHGASYWFSGDMAAGSKDPQECGDRLCGIMWRRPFVNEAPPGMNIEPDQPVQVAAIRTTVEVADFTRLVLHACAYYNHALLGPESRGEHGAAFVALTQEWPRYYRHTVVSNKTRKPSEKLGFYTSGGTRKVIFDLVGDVIKDATREPFRFKHITREAYKLIKDDRGRPDHQYGGSTDSLIACGIGLFIWKYANGQIPDHDMSQVYMPSGHIDRRTHPLVQDRVAAASHTGGPEPKRIPLGRRKRWRTT